MPGYIEWLISLKNFVTECLLKVQTFLNQYAKKCSAGKWYMDGWIKLQKERKYHLLMKCSVSAQKTLVGDLHAADVCYHLDCWFGVTKIHACWSAAIVTTISSIIC